MPATSYANGVKQGVTGTPGTSTITLGSAVSPYFTAAQKCTTSLTYAYSIVDGTTLCLGHGVVTNTAGTWTLARDAAEECNVAGTPQSTPASLTSAAVVSIAELSSDLAAFILGTGPTISRPQFDHFKLGYTTTATAAGTTTLTNASNCQQFFTGVTTQTVTLPVASTMVLGQYFEIVNNSTGVVTVQSSGSNTILAQAAATSAVYVCILTSGTSAASWAAAYNGFNGVTGTGNTVLANSPTLVTPALGTPASGNLANCTGMPDTHPGYVASNWYPAQECAIAGGTAGIDTIRLSPFVLPKAMTVSDLGARIGATQAGQNIQLAIYAASASTKRPTGNAIAVTGNMSTASATTVSADITGANVALAAGTLYWAAVNCSHATPTVSAPLAGSGNSLGSWLVGSATLATVLSAANISTLNLTVAQTFNTWPDLTSASFTEVSTTNGVFLMLKAA